jgi:hypothetical protein
MIKKYNEFLKGKTNEEFVMAPAPAVSPSETETQVPTRPGIGRPLEEPAPPSLIPDQAEENAPAKAFHGEEEEEGGDMYQQNLQHLADILGAQVADGSVNYEGKKITFPSETEMFHVDKKKFKTAEEVAAYLGNQMPKDEIRDELDSLKDDAVIDQLEMEEKFESKSYKTKRFSKFKK